MSHNHHHKHMMMIMMIFAYLSVRLEEVLVGLLVQDVAAGAAQQELQAPAAVGRGVQEDVLPT
jgi:hypothetical protein